MNQELLYASNRTFEELFQSAIDRAMLLLGKSGRQAIYYHLEKILGLERDKWHNHAEEIAEAIEQIFGRPGAKILLKVIAKELYSSLGLKYDETTEPSFSHVVRNAKRHFHRNLLKE